MPRVKGGFTVELKRPKRHLLNKPATPKAGWVKEGALSLAGPRTDVRPHIGASPDRDARAMAEKLFTPRATQEPRILPALSPISDARREPFDRSLPETATVAAAFVETEDAFVPNDPASEVTEDAVTLSGTPEPSKRQKTRRVPAVDLPPGKRWMRLLPSVLQESAVPRWKRMRSARVASRARRRPDETSDESL